MSKIVAKYLGGGIYQGLPARDLTDADLVEYADVLKEIGGLETITAPGAPYQRTEEKHAARRIPVAASAIEEETA